MTLRNYAFGAFVFDRQRKILLKNGNPVAVGQRCLALLEALLDAEGQIVSKSTLLLAAWKTENIEESNLAVQIAALRKVLGKTNQGAEWVSTIQRVGYQFVDPVRFEESPPGKFHLKEAQNDKPSLAVLPFRNSGSKVEHDFFSDGVSGDIITELTRWRMLSVRSRSASFQYKDTNPNIRRIAEELNVRYIVDGSIRRMSNRIRITVELVDTESGNQVWAENFDRGGEEIFAVQDQVVRTIVSTLVGRVIVATVEQVNRKPPNSLAAYECVLKGNSLSWDDAKSATEAKRLFEKAIELDPSYGMAHALLATMQHRDWYHDLSNSASVPESAIKLARRAVELDSNESTCLSILSLLELANRSFDAARRHIQRAIELNTNNQWNSADMGIVQHFLGNWNDAIMNFEKAREIDPYFDPPWYFRHLGQTYMALRRYDDALAMFSLCRTKSFLVWAFMGACYARLNLKEQATECANACVMSLPTFSVSKFLLKEPYKDLDEMAFLKEGLLMAGLPE